jgi:acyl-coenzyme A synthetase/AMP-(fatty) acid ligase
MNVPDLLTLYSSGSTDRPKTVTHSHVIIESMIIRTINELKLTKSDIVLNFMPHNVIAYYCITGLPSIVIGCKLITIQFDPYEFIKVFNEHRPTITVLLPRHIDILSKIKGFSDLDMSCVRYLVTGSQTVPQTHIDLLLSKGVQFVGNWYGSTEFPPPVFIGHNSNVFDFTTKEGYHVEFDSTGECIINGHRTGDIFDLNTKQFLSRIKNATNSTWKS